VQGFVFGINLKGTENVVMEGIRAFTQAMEKSGVTLAPPVTRPALKPGGKKTETAVIDQELDETVDETPEENLEVENDTEEAEESINGSKRERRVPKTPTVLNDVDFNTGTVTLKDFVAEKNPTDNYERYAVIAVWYKDYANTAEVNDDRIYTAYKFLNVIPPNDVGQILRDLKSKPSKKWFDKGDARGAYKINIIGMNKVQAGFGG
jgi:hypothetical protein